MGKMGGLWTAAPRMSGVMLIFALASLGLPGLGSFIGEFLVLVGTYQANVWMAALAAIGLVLSTVYSLRIMARAFYGESRSELSIRDLSMREAGLMAPMILLMVWLGMFPQTALNAAAPTVKAIQSKTIVETITAAGHQVAAATSGLRQTSRRGASELTPQDGVER
jgi:NADH-quinone oxidoreductase subunit M